jgi:anti-sigma regulatory factor (Ser/Thr protein kinase)
MGKPIKLTMTLPSIPNIELVAISGMEQMAQHLGINGERVSEARLLIAEAIINAMEYAADVHPKVDVEFTMNEHKLTIFIRDYGHGFELAQVEEPVIARRLGHTRKRGWGLKLIKELSDNLKIDSDRKGTRITIIKKLT